MEAAGEKTPAPAEGQGALGPGDRPKSADEVVQTGRDHGE
jgi:hypothetical protein